jgi:hypothetical protein
LSNDVYFDVSVHIKSLVGIVRKHGGECYLAWSLNSFFKFFNISTICHGKFFNSGESLEILVCYDEIPVVSLQVRIVSRMNISALLSFFKIQVLNGKFAGENISNDDFIFTFDLSCHFYLNKWQASDA